MARRLLTRCSALSLLLCIAVGAGVPRAVRVRVRRLPRGARVGHEGRPPRRPPVARRKYKSIIEEVPGTTCAKTAEEELKALR